MSFSSSDLEKFGTLKCIGNELYDLSIPDMRSMYDEIVHTEPAHAISRDTTSFDEIKDRIGDATKKYPGDGIVILSGAYPHMIGAVVELQKQFNITYVPIDGMQVSTQTVDGKNTLKPDFLKRQISRDIGVTKHIGFNSLEDTKAAIDAKSYDPTKQDLIVIALCETPPHGLEQYVERKKKFYPQLTQMILDMDQKPAFVSYIAEDMNIKTM